MSNHSNNNDTMLKFKGNSEFEKCHLMPCLIEYDKTTVNAKEYFWPTIKEMKEGGDEDQGRDRKVGNDANTRQQNNDPKNPILTASFRGRPLQGKKLDLPESYQAQVVINNSDRSKTTKSIKELYYWNWDEIPNKDDKVVKALQWIELAKVMHDGLTDLS